jgi:predicted nucleic acid-binding Zn finger protein
MLQQNVTKLQSYTLSVAMQGTYKCIHIGGVGVAIPDGHLVQCESGDHLHLVAAITHAQTHTFMLW